jgi:site-specific DNA-methyltransferase (adenine-specific)
MPSQPRRVTHPHSTATLQIPGGKGKGALIKDNDKRANPAGRIWDDVWGIDPPIPRVCGTFKERLAGFPTQLPLALLRPIIGCATDPNDLILDPFSGSATTGVAALELGRRYIGIERSPEFAARSRERLAKIVNTFESKQ